MVSLHLSRPIAVVVVVVLLAAGAASGPRDAAAAQAPVTTHTLDPAEPDGLNGWYRQSPVEVTLSVDDSGGVAVDRTEFRVNGGPWVEYGGLAPEEVIFDGTQESFDRWRQAGPGRFLLLPDGTMLATGGLGMLWYPQKAYGDVAISMQWRDVRPDTGFANSGVFVRFPDPDEAVTRPADERYSCQTGSGQTQPAWVAIFCGQEIQIYDGPAGEPQKTGSVYNFAPLDLAAAQPTPKGEWNDYEIRTVGGGDYEVTVTRNGEVINSWQNSPGQESSRAGDPPTDDRQFADGYIGIQNHGNQDLIQFRDIRVQDLTPQAPIRIAEPGQHTIEYRSVDVAGNVEETRSVSVKVDPTAPTTAATLDPPEPDGPDGAYTGPVTVTLEADDGERGSGVARTEYRVDGGEWQPYEGSEEVLFDGTPESFSRWRQAGPGGFLLLEDGSMQSFGGLGMLWYEPDEFGDIAVTMQWRDAREDDGFTNSGVFVRFPHPDGSGPGSVAGRYPCEPLGRPAWVAIFCGHEIQIYDGPTGEPQKTGSVYNFRPLSLEQARPTPKGGWNDYEIRTVGGGDYTVTVIRNGEVINTWQNSPGQLSSRPGDPPTDLRQYATGYISLQNHGGADVVQFRDIRVRHLSPEAAAFTVSEPGAHTVEYRSVDVAGNVEDIQSVSFVIQG